MPATSPRARSAWWSRPPRDRPRTTTVNRQPARSRSKPKRTKWSGCAQERAEFYLLVDRALKAAKVTLFTEPNPERGIYEGEQSWAFGETVVLPEPFGVEIPTGEWEPWE